MNYDSSSDVSWCGMWNEWNRRRRKNKSRKHQNTSSFSLSCHRLPYRTDRYRTKYGRYATGKPHLTKTPAARILKLPGIKRSSSPRAKPLVLGVPSPSSYLWSWVRWLSRTPALRKTGRRGKGSSLGVNNDV